MIFSFRWIDTSRPFIWRNVQKKKFRFSLRFDYEFCKWDKSSLYDINRVFQSFIFNICLVLFPWMMCHTSCHEKSSLTTALEMCALGRKNGTLNLERATSAHVLLVINARLQWSWCCSWQANKTQVLFTVHPLKLPSQINCAPKLLAEIGIT